MINISIDYISKGLILYGIVILILYLGMKLHVSWIDVSEKITRKKFFLRLMICFLVDTIIFLIIIFSEIVKGQNILVCNSMTNLGAILVVFYEILAISSIIQRCRCMIHSKFLMIVIMLFWIFNDFFKVLIKPVLLMAILVIGMLPDKNNSKEGHQE